VTTAPRLDLPVFTAPDGLVYVDRDGFTDQTLPRWRRLYDPVAVRRRFRVRAITHLGLGMAVVATAGALGLVVVWSLWGSGDDGANLVVGLLGGCLVGLWGTLFRVFFVRPRATPPPIVPVPAEVLLTHVATSSSVDVWRWSMAVSAEEEERGTIGYERYVERPSDAASASAARNRYAATYRAYASAAAEMGVPRRDPAVPLDVAS
jgi:hypothetical protein